jgi:plasmid stabilization system protein ParE
LAWHIHLAGQAEQDLLDITIWTAENFGTRQGRKGRHFVTFSASEGNIINVLRLLHDSMDLAKHLPEDNN